MTHIVQRKARQPKLVFLRPRPASLNVTVVVNMCELRTFSTWLHVLCVVCIGTVVYNITIMCVLMVRA